MATATASHLHTAATQPRRRDWRAIGFRGVALLIAFFVLGVSGMAANLLSPWKLVAASHPADYTPELHRWHGTDIAALLAVLVCGSLLALLPHPRRAPLLAQFIMLAIVIFTLSGAWPYAAAIVVPGAIIALLFVASYPDPRALVTFSREGAISLPLAAFAALAAIPLLGNAWTNLRLQHTDMTEHAHNFH